MDLYQKILISFLITCILFFSYKFLLNPQIIVSSATQTCPNDWTYEKPLCIPPYGTACNAFDPSKITSKATKLNIIKKCGLIWP